MLSSHIRMLCTTLFCENCNSALIIQKNTFSHVACNMDCILISTRSLMSSYLNKGLTSEQHIKHLENTYHSKGQWHALLIDGSNSIVLLWFSFHDLGVRDFLFGRHCIVCIRGLHASVYWALLRDIYCTFRYLTFCKSGKGKNGVNNFTFA